MQINIEKLSKLVLEADKIFIDPSGEDVLVQLLELQGQVETAIEEAKKKLEEAAMRLNPDFRSIQADRVKVYYREYGSKYYIDESLISQVPKDLYTTTVKHAADGKAIDKWVDQNKGLPLGVKESERTKKISFTLKEKEGHDQV